MKNWRNNKIENLELFYGKAYKQFREQDPHDDRRLYINLYEMIMEALESLPGEPNSFVIVAMNNRISDELKTMREIGRHFRVDAYIFNKPEEE